MDTNERIRMARKQLGLTQTKFAELLGLSLSQVKNIELKNRLKNGITADTVKLISKTFNISEKWLLSGEGDMFEPNTEPPEHTFIINSLKALKPHQIKLIESLIKEFK